jgi:hypothetical protein
MLKMDYNSAAENTLRKVMAQRFLPALEATIETNKTTFEQLRVAGLLLRGSAKFAWLDDPPLITRGQRDIDAYIVPIRGLAIGGDSKRGVESSLRLAAESAGLSLTRYQTSDLSLHEKLVQALRRKSYYMLTAPDSAALAQSATNDPNLHLTARDRSILRDIAEGRTHAPAIMDMNLHLRAVGTDLPPVGKQGQILSSQGVFGVGVAHPLSDLAGQVQFINFYDDKYTVYPDLACATAALNGGRGFLPQDLATITHELYQNPKSQYREYLPLRMATQLKDGITRMEPWRTVVHGLSLLNAESNVRLLHQPPTDERVAVVMQQLNERIGANLIDREVPFTAEETRQLIAHTHRLSTILLSKEGRRDMPPEGFGGEVDIRRMLHMELPTPAEGRGQERKPETPGYVREILEQPPSSQRGPEKPGEGPGGSAPPRP